jgi:hypothetical protein
MNFRIRNTDVDDKSFESFETKYRNHLKRFVGISNSDLWKYFYWDFFHDGPLEFLKFQKDLSTVIMRICCPNIKRLKADGAYEYLNFSFKCTFSEVISFNMHSEKPVSDWYSGKHSAIYLYSEINTSPILETLDYGKDDYPAVYYSLLIQFLVDNSFVWLEIVFNQVDVVADEPGAFALMESDPKYEIPTYSVENGK